MDKQQSYPTAWHPIAAGILLFSVLIMVLIGNVSAMPGRKKPTFSYTLDTLSIFNDSVLVKIRSYRSGRLTAEDTSFIFHDTVSTYRSGRFRSPGKKSKPVLALLMHGTCMVYLEDGRRYSTAFIYGLKKARVYYDKGGREVTEKEFYGNVPRFGLESSGKAVLYPAPVR